VKSKVKTVPLTLFIDPNSGTISRSLTPANYRRLAHSTPSIALSQGHLCRREDTHPPQRGH